MDELCNPGIAWLAACVAGVLLVCVFSSLNCALKCCKCSVRNLDVELTNFSMWNSLYLRNWWIERAQHSFYINKTVGQFLVIAHCAIGIKIPFIHDPALLSTAIPVMKWNQILWECSEPILFLLLQPRCYSDFTSSCNWSSKGLALILILLSFSWRKPACSDSLCMHIGYLCNHFIDCRG